MVTVGYFLAFIALGLVSASLGPTLPGLAENTHTQLDRVSFLFAGRSAGYLIGSLAAGRLYDRLPGNPVMAAVLFLISVLMIVVPQMQWIWLLVLVMLLVGASEAIVDVGGNTLLVWHYRDRVGPFMNGLHFFFGLGAFLSPLIVAQAIIWSGEITLAYWGLSVLALPAALWLSRLESPKGQSAQTSKPTTSSANRLVMLCAIFFFLYVGAEVSFGGWVFTYARELSLASEATAAYLTSAFWGSLTVGRLLAIPLAKRYRPGTLLFVDLIGCAASMAVILMWPGSSTALWAGALGLGFSMASVFPTTISLAERRMVITGRVTSWFFVGASTGGMTFPWLIGQFFESFGPLATMVTISINLLLLFAVYLVLIRHSRTEPAARIGC